MTARRSRSYRALATVYVCDTCEATLMARPSNMLFGGGWEGDWFMLKDRVWRAAATRGTKTRFLCVSCTEHRLGRKLTAGDFRRSAKVNFFGRKSPRLQARMRGLRPAKRLINTRFVP